MIDEKVVEQIKEALKDSKYIDNSYKLTIDYNPYLNAMTIEKMVKVFVILQFLKNIKI